MSGQLTVERDGAVMTVLLDNPPYNFLTAAMMHQLHVILDGLDDEPEVRVVVLTSAVPDVFISHYDVSEILGGVESLPVQLSPRVAGAAIRALGAASHVPGAKAGLSAAGGQGVLDLREYHAVTHIMRSSDKIFIAAINGRAMGGGCELALACDIRLMADGPYEIGQPEILVGLIPGGGGTQMLPRTVGTTRALELCLDGRPLSPTEAAEIGLITRAVPPSELMSETMRLAERLARR
ncbi:MAG TPA: enoyl-CoA hydratase/isomerase family protein, partial [Nocardioidaceae bacterium]|nr:enoyl-CoA hydratase/isomerase family protein [Nocardioidaceae bacterium]